MVSLKKYNLDGSEFGEFEIDDEFVEVDANHQMIKDYIVAIRANGRQWSASTKGRSDVSHSTKKPYAQKGTGNARQGCLVSPQYRGGGIVFGPKPKFNQHVRINRKERKAAIHYLLSEKIKSSKVIVLDDAAWISLDKPSTKQVFKFLKTHGVERRRVLFVGSGDSSVESKKKCIFRKSINNLPKSGFSLAANINGYDLMAANSIIIGQSAFSELKKLLS